MRIKGAALQRNGAGKKRSCVTQRGVQRRDGGLQWSEGQAEGRAGEGGGHNARGARTSPPQCPTTQGCSHGARAGRALSDGHTDTPTPLRSRGLEAPPFRDTQTEAKENPARCLDAISKSE